MFDNLDIEAAKTFAAATLANATLPRLEIVHSDHPKVTRELAALFRAEGRMFDRNGPVTISIDPMTRTTRALPLTAGGVMHAAHRVCRPFAISMKKDVPVERDVTLSKNVAALFLDLPDSGLLPLNGITSAPILGAGGEIRTHDGYDAASGFWCEHVPNVAPMVPDKPTKAEAHAALRKLRQMFRTFCFADAERVKDPKLNVDVVDVTKPPNADESALLVAILTAVCRPSLHLAPGFLIVAPAMSGAGSGKGLLARAVSLIAFGCQPQAFTSGHDPAELDKRLAAEFMEAGPVVFLDNVNATALKSDTLASVLTERPARVRIMGESRMVALNAAAFIVVAGNGLTVAEDLVRRFVTIGLDAKLEDPEARPFKDDFLATITKDRPALLAAALTVWRWGRMQGAALQSGAALGSYGQWCKWIRDPLFALGCKDPVPRISEAKAGDANRQNIAELFAAWFERHHDYPTKAADLHEDVVALIDPQKRGRQFISALLPTLVGTRVAGLVLTVTKPPGKWGASTYAIKQIAATPQPVPVEVVV